MQQVIKLSVVNKEIKRLQAKHTAIVVAGTGNPATSTPNPNINRLSQTPLNPLALPFALTLPFPLPQPWKMPVYAISFKTPLCEIPGGKLMASTNTQMGLQVPTSAAKLPVQPLPKDNSHSYKISQVQPNRVNTFQTQTPIAKLKRKSVIKRSMPSESNDSSSTMSRLEPPKVDYAAK